MNFIHIQHSFPGAPAQVHAQAHPQVTNPLPSSHSTSFVFLEGAETIGVWKVLLKNPSNPAAPFAFAVAVYSDSLCFYYRLWKWQDSNPAFIPSIKSDPNTDLLRSELVFDKKRKTLETNTNSISNDAEFFAILYVFLTTSINLPSFKLDVSNPVLRPLKDLYEKQWGFKSSPNFLYQVDSKTTFLEKFNLVPACILHCDFC